MDHVTEAVKDDNGRIEWVTLDPGFHSHLVKSAMKLSDVGGAIVKRTMFVFILELLNSDSGNSFFELKDGAAAEERAHHEKRRIARKLARAAKRERVREAAKVRTAAVPKDEVAITAQGTAVCRQCGKTFKSRKRLSRHRKTCAHPKPTPKSIAGPSGSVSKHTTTAPVIAGSGNYEARYVGRGVELSFLRVATRIECENCSNQAAGLKLDRYPKCLDCKNEPFEFYPGLEDQWRAISTRT